MSDTSHKGERSKYAALRELCVQMRRDAARQRAWCATQRHVLHVDEAPPPRFDAVVDANGISTETASALVAFTGSAGGLIPLMTILADLPANFAAAVVVAPHMGESSVLPQLLQRRCRLPVEFVCDGEIIRAGRIYVCPPRRHVLANAERTFALAETDPLSMPCPSGDWLFHTVAASYGEQAAVIVLSGSQSDGARGVRRVQAAGGIVLVQDPQTCAVPSMPLAALHTNCVRATLRPEQIAPSLVAMIGLMDLERSEREFANPFQSSN